MWLLTTAEKVNVLNPRVDDDDNTKDILVLQYLFNGKISERVLWETRLVVDAAAALVTIIDITDEANANAYISVVTQEC